MHNTQDLFTLLFLGRRTNLWVLLSDHTVSRPLLHSSTKYNSLTLVLRSHCCDRNRCTAEQTSMDFKQSLFSHRHLNSTMGSWRGNWNSRKVASRQKPAAVVYRVNWILIKVVKHLLTVYNISAWVRVNVIFQVRIMVTAIKCNIKHKIVQFILLFSILHLQRYINV